MGWSHPVCPWLSMAAQLAALRLAPLGKGKRECAALAMSIFVLHLLINAPSPDVWINYWCLSAAKHLLSNALERSLVQGDSWCRYEPSGARDFVRFGLRHGPSGSFFVGTLAYSGWIRSLHGGFRHLCANFDQLLFRDIEFELGWFWLSPVLCFLLAVRTRLKIGRVVLQVFHGLHGRARRNGSRRAGRSAKGPICTKSLRQNCSHMKWRLSRPVAKIKFIDNPKRKERNPGWQHPMEKENESASDLRSSQKTE
jgi:hypothetical protein